MNILILICWVNPTLTLLKTWPYLPSGFPVKGYCPQNLLRMTHFMSLSSLKVCRSLVIISSSIVDFETP